MKRSLTPEETDRQFEVRDKWIERALNNPSINEDKAKELVAFLYELADLKVPPVYVTGSPDANQKKAKELMGDNYSYVYSYDCNSDCSWVAFYDFFTEIGLVEDERFTKLRDLMYESGVWEILTLDDAAILCGGPSEVRKVNGEPDGALHSDQAPAIAWEDGFELYFLNGVHFEYEDWKKIVDKTMTIEEVSRFSNADERSVATSFLSPERLLDHVGAELINTGMKGTKLYKVENFQGSDSPEYCMTMKCPSTGRIFLEWCQPEVGEVGDADFAQASTWIDEEGETLSIEDYLTMVES